MEGAMKLRLALLIAFLLPVAAVPAFADPPAPATAASGPGVYTAPTVTVYGRPNKPSVVIVVKPPAAADMAALAHESLRRSLLAQSAPAPLDAPH
jgi:hypothetical protein